MVKKASFSELHISYIVQDNMHTRPKIVVIIPIYNESKVIADVVSGVRKANYEHIIIVDDGSADNSFEVIQKLPVIALRHRINRGKGAALRTGIEAAKMLQADIVITIDGDGQHEATDIDNFVQAFQKQHVDVVLGVRQIEKENMPITRKVANWIADKVTFVLYGINIQDTQSGFRGFSARAIHLIKTRSNAYSYESEVLREMKKHRLSYTDVPIHVRYTAYSTSKKHKQNMVNGIKTLYTMVWNILS